MKVDTSWFRVFNDLIHSGQWAQLSPNAKALYPVIKSFVGMEGEATPTIAKLQEFSGLSKNGVMLGMRELIDCKLVLKESQERKSSRYTIMERFEGHSNAQKTLFELPYYPGQIQALIEELKAFVAAGDVPPNVVINIVVGEHNTVNTYMDKL